MNYLKKNYFGLFSGLMYLIAPIILLFVLKDTLSIYNEEGRIILILSLISFLFGLYLLYNFTTNTEDI